jgi:hypothetical protein
MSRSLKCRHRNGDPEKLRQRRRHFEEGMQEGGNTGRSLRGNPEKLETRRLRDNEKVTNLERGGRARESQASLFVGKTLEGNCQKSASGRKAQERMGS